MPRKARKPAYLLHKATGQARVRIGNHDFNLAVCGSPESRDRYDELVREWMVKCGVVDAVAITCDELAIRYKEFAEAYYDTGGSPSRR